MAEAVDLPEGFVLDDSGFDLPPGFVADAPKGPSFAAQVGSAAVRPLAKGVAALPLMAMDAGVGLRNFIQMKMNPAPAPSMEDLIAGRKPKSAFQPYELPSSMFNRMLDQYTLPPEGAGKAAELISSALVGSRLPAPQAGTKPPAGFIPPAQMLRNQTVAQAQKEGYVVPPGTANPTFGNRLLEGLSGKLKLQQEAATSNQAVTNELMARSVGQNTDAPLTQGALSLVRGEAARKGYDPLRSLGKIATDQKYIDTLDDITKAAQGASRSFPGLKPTKEVDDVVSALKQKEFNSGDALDAVSHLRELADDAYASGNRLLGKAYKSASKAIEDMVERDLAGRGDDGAAMLKSFREARTLMAKTYTAGKALVEDTGSFNARKMASELAKGKPLAGEQRIVAGFATAFPKVSRLMDESYPSISPLDAYGSAIAAGAADSAAPLAIPLTRVGIREYLLSPAGQQRAIQQAAGARETLGLLGAYPSLANEFTGGLFGQ